MELLTEDNAVKLHDNSSVEAGIASLIETVEVLRRCGVKPNNSYTQDYFSSVRKYLS